MDFLTSSDKGVGMGEAGHNFRKLGKGCLWPTQDTHGTAIQNSEEICHLDSRPGLIRPPGPIMFSFTFLLFSIANRD